MKLKINHVFSLTKGAISIQRYESSFWKYVFSFYISITEICYSINLLCSHKIKIGTYLYGNIYFHDRKAHFFLSIRKICTFILSKYVVPLQKYVLPLLKWALSFQKYVLLLGKYVLSLLKCIFALTKYVFPL